MSQNYHGPGTDLLQQGENMIFWRGYGILVFVFTVVCMIAAKAGAETLWGTPVPIDKRQWFELVGMWIAAAAVFGLHLALQRTMPPRTVVDKQTGQELILVARHDLFFIPVKFWPIALVGLGLLLFFRK